MAQTRNVAVLVGSLRKDSLNRKLALALAGTATEGLKLEIAEIGKPTGNNAPLVPPFAGVHQRRLIFWRIS